MSDTTGGHETQGRRKSSSAHVSLFGAGIILDPDGRALDVPRIEASLLALLCGIGRSVHRLELIEALAISTSTLRPVLSRLPKSLAIPGPVHLVDGNRSGHVRLNPSFVHHDGAQIEEILDLLQPPLARVDAILRATEGPVLVNSGLVADHPLTVEATDRLHSIRDQLGERRNNLIAQAESATDLDVGGIVLPSLSLAATKEERRSQRPAIVLPATSLIWERADANAKLGYWAAANEDYRLAIRSAQRSDDPTTVARICLKWAQIAWDPVIGNEVDDILRGVVSEIEQPSLKAQVRICFLGGTYQSGTARRELPTPAEFDLMINDVERDAVVEDLAWALIRARKALLGSVSPEQSLAMAERIVEVGRRSPLIRAQGLQAQFADLIRIGRMNETRLTLSTLEALTDNPESALQAMGQLISRGCWNLALGRYEVVQDCLAQAVDFRPRVGGPTVDQAIVAQSFWLARERLDRDTLLALREGALVLAASDRSTPVWAVATAALEVDLGLHEQGLATLESALDAAVVSCLPDGAHRPGILALAAETLGMVANAGLIPDPVLAEAVVTMLEREQTKGVLFGWPTIYLGSKRRFLGLASLATTRPQRAGSFLRDAVRDDRLLPPLRARSLEALALTGDVGAATQAALIRSGLEERLSRVGA